MLIYNVTVNLEPSIVEEWLEWMTTVHIPEVVATGYFQSYQLFKILKEDAEHEYTYCIQYQCESYIYYKQYQIEEAPRLQAKHTQKFEGKFIAFRTLLQTL